MHNSLTENTTTLCRMCLKQINNFSQCGSLENQESNEDSIRYKLSRCIPELDLDAVPGTKICNYCFIVVNFIYDFKNKCLQTEKKIKTYLGGMFSSAAFVEFILGEQVQQTPLEIVHSGLLNKNSQPVNIQIENRADITEGTSLHFQNIPNKEISDLQIQAMQAVDNIQTEDILCESPQQTDLQIQSNDMTDVQIQDRSVEIIDVDSSDHEHEIIDDTKFERTNNAYTTGTPSEPSISQNKSNQSNIEINHGLSNTQHQCNICSRMFVSKASLTSHRILCKFNKRLNNPMSLYKCSKCYFTSQNKAILTYHENLLHINGIAVDDKGPYKCHICANEFLLPQSLNQHVQCHPPTQLMKCDKCNYSSYYSNRLKQHKQSHLQKCPHCNSTMLKKSSLNTHIRRKHNNLNEFSGV